MGIWAIRSPLKIHCYTCMSFETCWSRLIYMKLSSHRSFVINMYVVTMAWHCSSPRSFYRSLQKRREIDIFRICQPISAHSEVKTTEKKRGKPRLNARCLCLNYCWVTTQFAKTARSSEKQAAVKKWFVKDLITRVESLTRKQPAKWYGRPTRSAAKGFSSVRRP